MSDVKHTAGPFVAQQAQQGHFEIVAPNAPKTKRRIARLGGPDREANAALFAAAPDMLEALESLLDANDGVQDELCNGPDVPGFDPQALGRAQIRVTQAEKAARAAIAAAKGGR